MMIMFHETVYKTDRVTSILFVQDDMILVDWIWTSTDCDRVGDFQQDKPAA